MESLRSFMLQAIALGERGRLTAAPNPWVGCVVVQKGEIVGEGFHRKRGGPHAEVRALEEAKEQARNADLFVTLEPCSHYGRTPPCAKAVIDAGVRRVYVAVSDPDPKVCGRGIEMLRAAGVAVEVGLCAKEAEESLAPYLFHRRYQRSFCWLKAAVSVDGRMAAADGSSQWISCPAARKDAHSLRAASQAILVGTQTAILDQPRLTVRDIDLPPDFVPPLRVALDAKGRIPPEGPLFDPSLGKTLIFTTKKSTSAIRKTWESRDCEWIEMEEGMPLELILRYLSDRGVLQVLVEGGPTILTHFLEEQRAQRLTIYVGPRLIGHAGAPLFYNNRRLSIDEACQLQPLSSTLIGNTTRTDYTLPCLV